MRRIPFWAHLEKVAQRGAARFGQIGLSEGGKPFSTFRSTVRYALISSILSFSAFPASAADTRLDWSSRPSVDLTAASDAATVDGITVTTSGSVVGSRTSDTLAITPTTTTNGYSGIITSELNATIDNESVYNQIVFGFSEPVYNLRFRVIDIDGYNVGGTRFSDLMTLTSSAGVPSSVSAGSQVTYTAATGRAIENNTSNCSGDQAICQINVVYDGPITSATVNHVAADAAGGTNPTNQAIQIFDLTFNTAPDATNNTATTFPGGSISGNVITDNDGNGTDSDRQDGASVSVNQISHPDGTLSVGGGGATLTLANGASLTIAQDGSYTFATNGAYSGLASGASTTETFTYRIEDLEGLFNTNGDSPNPDSVATLVVTISNTSNPSFSINKTVDQAGITSPGNLTYTIDVTNTGNVELTGTSLADTLTQGGTPLTLTSGPTLVSGDTDSDLNLDVGEVWSYTATFAVAQSNLDDGNNILNIAVFDTAETSSQSSSASTTTPGPTFACAGDNFPGNTISGATGSTVCLTTGATGETGEPNPTGGAVESIWYTWTAPLTGTVEFNTCDVGTTDYDTTLGAYTGTAVNSLSTIIENDDGTGCSNFSSRLSFSATAGTTYRIRVDGYQGSDGTFKLDWAMTAPAAAINKSVNQSTISGVTTLTYTIIVDNTGTENLTSPNLTDQLVQNGSNQTLTSGPTLSSGDLDGDGVLDTDETWIYSATYDVTSANITDGNDLENTASFTSTETPTAVSSTATTTISAPPSLSIVKSFVLNKLAGNTGASAEAGDTIVYSYVVTNDGSQTVSNIDVDDSSHTGLGTFADPVHNGSLTSDNGSLGDSPDSNADPAIWGTLGPSDVITFTASYVVTQADMDAQP